LSLVPRSRRTRTLPARPGRAMTRRPSPFDRARHDLASTVRVPRPHGRAQGSVRRGSGL